MPPLLDKRLLFVTGKGGVGKTTVATALGLAAAARGKRTIVCEVTQEERVSHAFARDRVGYSEIELASDLYGISIDPQHALEEYLADQIGSERLSGFLLHNRLFDYFITAAPGVRELVTIGKAWELAQHERRNTRAPAYDLVIVDAPSSGHALAMLTTPRTYREVASVGPISRQAGYIFDFITDPACTAVVAVALPEEMPVTETVEFGAMLSADVGIAPELVIVNALLPERFTADEAAEISAAASRDGAPEIVAALHAALSEHHRARLQRAQLRRLRRQLDHVVTIPFVWQPQLGLDELARLATELGRKL